jgi:hypothetical protein
LQQRRRGILYRIDFLCHHNSFIFGGEGERHLKKKLFDNGERKKVFLMKAFCSHNLKGDLEKVLQSSMNILRQSSRLENFRSYQRLGGKNNVVENILSVFYQN